MDNFMYSFLVLGLVPGTHLQINFQDWVHMTEAAMLVIVSASTLRLYLSSRRQFATPIMALHQPLSAGQLHQRLSL